MRRIENRPLWIGHAGDLRDPSSVLALGIEAVVEVADNEQLAVLPRELVRLRFPLSDGYENKEWLVRSAVDSVSTLLSAHIPTLVCCSNGLSRSVCVAAGALAVVERKPFDAMLIEVAGGGPADVSPGLIGAFRAACRDR